MQVIAQSNYTYQIKGVSGEALSNVENRLTSLQHSYGDKDLSPENIQVLYSQSRVEIKKALEPFGYFKASVKQRLTHSGSTWRAEFKIQPGPILKISKVDVQIDGPGKNNPVIQNYVHNFPVKAGQVFSVEKYEKAKEELFQIVNNQGYVKASLQENNVLIDLQKYTAKIIVYLETGPLYYFGPVMFEENPYGPHFLRRFIPFKENEPFSSQKLVKFQQELASSYYFQKVVVLPDFEHAENQRVPIKISLSAPKSQYYSFGVGYGSFTGPRFTANVKFRRLTDTGQHFDAQIKLSRVLSAIAGKYYIPGENPLTDQWVLGANYQKFMPENGSSNSGTFSAGYIKKYNDWQATFNLNYLLERYKVENKPSEKSNLLYPSFNLFYSNADDYIHPKVGKSLNISLQGASHTFLSSTSFLQGEIKAKYLFSPTSFSHIILRGDLGYTIVNNLQDLPLSLRYFAGGINSIRGYKDSSIGPGKFLQIGSLEYQNHLVGNWTGAVFYDIGAASNHFATSFKKGAGVGLIYDSMIGPVKLYVARALSSPGQPYAFEFNIGPEF